MILESSTSFGIAITICVPMYPGKSYHGDTLRATSSERALVKPCMPALAGGVVGLPERALLARSREETFDDAAPLALDHPVAHLLATC